MKKSKATTRRPTKKLSFSRASKVEIAEKDTEEISSNPTVNVRWFKEQLKRAGLSQRQAAKILQINQSIISHMFGGRRKMGMEDAIAWSDLLKVPLNDVISNAGIKLPNEAIYSVVGVPPQGEAIPIKGWVDNDLKVRWEQPKGAKTAPNPFGGAFSAAGGLACLRIQTPGGAYDGALAYYREMGKDEFDYDGVGKFCLVKTGGEYFLRVPLRGYEPGKHNLTLFNGQMKEESVVVEAATPILWMKL